MEVQALALNQSALNAPGFLASSPLKQQTQATPAILNFPHPKPCQPLLNNPHLVVYIRVKDTRDPGFYQLGFSLHQVGKTLPLKSDFWHMQP